MKEVIRMLIDWMKEHDLLDKETRLTLSLERIVKDRYGNGNDCRYFRCFLMAMIFLKW
jgi:hypothetical protein